MNKKHLKNVGPIRYCEPFYIDIHQVSLAATVARRLRIDVHDDDDNNNNDNAWQRGPLAMAPWKGPNKWINEWMKDKMRYNGTRRAVKPITLAHSSTSSVKLVKIGPAHSEITHLNAVEH